jgi:hypothetical protein
MAFGVKTIISSTERVGLIRRLFFVSHSSAAMCGILQEYGSLTSAFRDVMRCSPCSAARLSPFFAAHSWAHEPGAQRPLFNLPAYVRWFKTKMET